MWVNRDEILPALLLFWKQIGYLRWKHKARIVLDVLSQARVGGSDFAQILVLEKHDRESGEDWVQLGGISPIFSLHAVKGQVHIFL